MTTPAGVNNGIRWQVQGNNQFQVPNEAKDPHMSPSHRALTLKNASQFSNPQRLRSPSIGCQNSHSHFLIYCTCHILWDQSAYIMELGSQALCYQSLAVPHRAVCTWACHLHHLGFCAFLKQDNVIILHGRASQPQHDWHLGPDHSLWWGLPCALWEAWQHPDLCPLDASSTHSTPIILWQWKRSHTWPCPTFPKNKTDPG